MSGHIQSDKSDEFNKIIYEKVIPLLNEIFSSYIDEPANCIKQTEYLYTSLKENNRGLKILEHGFNNFYEIDKIPDSFYRIILKLNKTGFSLLIVPLDNYENSPSINNVSFSFNRTIQMYMYGVKANGIGPKIRGNVLNNSAFLICKAMHISKLYIYDNASITCYWNKSIEIQHFSILRILAGKHTFYSSLPGHYYNVEKANSEIEQLQRCITADEKRYVLYYLNCIENKTSPTAEDDCYKIIKIIDKGIRILGSRPEILRYVATPY